MDKVKGTKALTKPVRVKVKTGCRTCKIRKVKCDEGRPACRRCVSTGRVCDGYGIWGGGGGGGGGGGYKQWSISVNNRKISIQYPFPVLLGGKLSRDEHSCFEWFIDQTVSKLSGLYESTFWETLVTQTGSTEPATLHALLALSSAHKSDTIVKNWKGETGDLLNEQEKFTLKQYNKAIVHLQNHISTKSKESLRVALITCMIFISLEMLRRQYKASNIHLQHGLKLLSEIQSHSISTNDDHILVLKDHPNSADDYIIEAFIRLNVQSVLFGLGSPHLHLKFQDSRPQTLPLMFQSMRQARQYLDGLLNKIHHLTRQARHLNSDDSHCRLELFDRQRQIQSDLKTWLQTYKASAISLKCHMGLRESVAFPLLHVYHTMATIMAGTSLSSSDELVFDLYNAEFTAIITETLNIWKQLASHPISQIKCKDRNAFTVDMGFNPPSYYTALKCRHPLVRRSAIRLLSLTPHREGVWDGVLIAQIGREVLKIEEGDLYADFDSIKNFDDKSDAELDELDLPILPGLRRIYEPQTILPNDPNGLVKLVYKQRQTDNKFKAYEKEISVSFC